MEIQHQCALFKKMRSSFSFSLILIYTSWFGLIYFSLFSVCVVHSFYSFEKHMSTDSTQTQTHVPNGYSRCKCTQPPPPQNGMKFNGLRTFSLCPSPHHFHCMRSMSFQFTNSFSNRFDSIWSDSIQFQSIK